MEGGEGVAVDGWTIRYWKMAAMMVVRGAVVILTIIGKRMMIVLVMIVVLMDWSAIFVITMGIFMNHSGRHSCENAESDELFEEKCHAFR